MFAEVINFDLKKRRIQIDNLNKLKNNYFMYLGMKSKGDEEINRMFMSDYQNEIRDCAREQGKSVESLLTDWKAEYEEKIIRESLDEKLIKQIENTIEEEINNGHFDKKRIFYILKIRYSDKISTNADSFFERIIEKRLNEVIGINR